MKKKGVATTAVDVIQRPITISRVVIEIVKNASKVSILKESHVASLVGVDSVVTDGVVIHGIRVTEHWHFR